MSLDFLIARQISVDRVRVGKPHHGLGILSMILPDRACYLPSHGDEDVRSPASIQYRHETETCDFLQAYQSRHPAACLRTSTGDAVHLCPSPYHASERQRCPRTAPNTSTRGAARDCSVSPAKPPSPTSRSCSRPRAYQSLPVWRAYPSLATSMSGAWGRKSLLCLSRTAIRSPKR